MSVTVFDRPSPQMKMLSHKLFGIAQEKLVGTGYIQIDGALIKIWTYRSCQSCQTAIS